MHLLITINYWASNNLLLIQTKPHSLLLSLRWFLFFVCLLYAPIYQLVNHIKQMIHMYIPCNIRYIYDLINVLYQELQKEKSIKYTILLYDPYNILSIYETNVEYMKSSIFGNVYIFFLSLLSFRSMGLPSFSFLNSPSFHRITSLTELDRYNKSSILLFDATFYLKNRSSIHILESLQHYYYSVFYVDDNSSFLSSLSILKHMNHTVYFYPLFTYFTINEINSILRIQSPTQVFLSNRYQSSFSDSTSITFMNSNTIYHSEPVLYNTIPIIVKPNVSFYYPVRSLVAFLLFFLLPFQHHFWIL